MAILIVFSSEALEMIFAVNNRAFLRSFGLVGEHMRFEILEDFSAVWMRASAFFFTLIFNFNAGRARTAH